MKLRIAIILAVLLFAVPSIWIVFTNPFGLTDVMIVVECDHQWSGGIGEGDVKGPLLRNGNYSQVMHKTFGGRWDVHIMAEKEDNSTDVLRIAIMTLDGKVLKSAMTTAPHEMILAEVIL